MPREELDRTDPVVGWLNDTRQQIERISTFLPLNNLLSNGKIERELKFVLAATWESKAADRRICLLEKKLWGCLVDLAALEKPEGQHLTSAMPKFWIETKCDFAEKIGNGRACAEDALDQIGKYFEIMFHWPPTDDQTQEIVSFKTRLIACDRYIVHFLNRVPSNANGLISQFIMDKYETVGSPLSPTQLENIYADSTPYFKATTKVGKANPLAVGRKSRLVYEKSFSVPIVASVLAPVYAVVIKLKRVDPEPSDSPTFRSPARARGLGPSSSAK